MCPEEVFIPLGELQKFQQDLQGDMIESFKKFFERTISPMPQRTAHL